MLANTVIEAMIRGLASTAALREGRVLATDAALDVERQVGDIERLVAAGVDALIVYPAGDPSVLHGAIDGAVAAGVPLFSHDELGYPAVAAKLVTPVRAMGALGADLLSEALGGEGTVAIVGGVEAPALVERIAGFRQRLESAHTGLRVVATVSNLLDTVEGAETVVAQLLAGGTAPNGLFGYNDASAIGAARAAAAAGATPVVVGNNAEPHGVRAVADGTIAGTVDRHPVELAQRGADLILDILEGRVEPGRPSEVTIEPTVVTRANVAAFVAWDARCPEPPAGSWEIV